MKKSTIIKMISEQHKMNSKASGHLWPIYLHKTNKTINWKRAIHLETAELIESFPWKHWKNVDAPIDILNVNIEISDIWHFLLSLIISDSIIDTGKVNENTTEDEMNSLIEKKSKKIAKKIKSYIKETKRESDFEDYNDENMDELLYPYEILALVSNPANEDSVTEDIALTFFDIVQNVLNIDIEKIYFGKMILNNFRNDNGYEAGTYIKNWNINNKEVEDNVVMFDLISNGLEKEELYKMLEEVYKNLN